MAPATLSVGVSVFGEGWQKTAFNREPFSGRRAVGSAARIEFVEPTNTVAIPVAGFAHRSAGFARTRFATSNGAAIRFADPASTAAIQAAGSARPWTGFAPTRSAIRRTREAEKKSSLETDDRIVDIVKGGLDVVILIGRMRDSGLLARKIAADRLVICASPAYSLERASRHRLPTPFSTTVSITRWCRATRGGDYAEATAP